MNRIEKKNTKPEDKEWKDIAGVPLSVGSLVVATVATSDLEIFKIVRFTDKKIVLERAFGKKLWVRFLKYKNQVSVIDPKYAMMLILKHSS